MPIRVKLSLWYSGVFLVVITLFCTYIYLFFTHWEMSQIDDYLQEKAKEVHHSIEVIDFYPFPMKRLVPPDVDVFSTPGIFLQIMDQEGKIISRSESLGEQSLPISKEAIRQISLKEDFYETKNVSSTQIRMYYMPLLSGNQFVGVIQVAESLYGFQRSLENLRMLLGLGAITTATLSAMIGWSLARQALQPIHRIIETTAEIEREGKLERRIDHTGPPDEIGLLSTQINSMMEKIEHMYRELEESYETQRRFVADASHELRTPLTSIRGNLDFLRKLYENQGEFSMDAMNDIIEEVERVSRMVHNLLALARADAGYKIQMERILLKDWFASWIDQVSNISSTQVIFRHDPLEKLNGITVIGNPDFLKQIFIILLENAFKYTHAGQVYLGFIAQPNQVKIFVKDTGVGITKEDITHVFDRFYRGGNVRQHPGTGLGLAIAQWIVEKHDGQISVESEIGVGTSVEVILPAQSAT